MITTHVLLNDWFWHGSGDKNVPLTKIPYLVLSTLKNLDNIESDLADVLGNIGVSSESEYLAQYLITDGTTTYILSPPESSSGPYVIQNATQVPKLANFRWVGRDTVNRDDGDIQIHPTGIERFNLMPISLDELRFTKAYESPNRLSEFIGIDGTTKDSTDAELEGIYERAHAIYVNRQRDGSTWQTVYSVVYSANGIEHLYVQENWDRDYAAATRRDLEILKEEVDAKFDDVDDDIDDLNQSVLNVEQNVVEAKKDIADIKSDIVEINTFKAEVSETGSIIEFEYNQSTYEFAAKLKDKNGNVISTTTTIDLPIESVVVDGRYDAAEKKVILVLKNGGEIKFSVSDLVAGLQTTLSATNKLNADFVDDTNSNNKFVSNAEKNTWNAKQSATPNGVDPLIDPETGKIHENYGGGGSGGGIPYDEDTEVEFKMGINANGGLYISYEESEEE